LEFEVKGKCKVIPMLNEVPRHEDILCSTKYNAMNSYGVMVAGIGSFILNFGTRCR